MFVADCYEFYLTKANNMPIKLAFNVSLMTYHFYRR